MITSLRRQCSTSIGSHPDFGRVVKPSPTSPVAERIKSHLDESKVVLYMKGVPTAPSCGFSWKTVQILNACGADYKAYNVLDDEELRQGIKVFSEWPTIPQLYIKGEFIGGSDLVETMARSGDLKTKLAEAGAILE